MARNGQVTSSIRAEVAEIADILQDYVRRRAVLGNPLPVDLYNRKRITEFGILYIAAVVAVQEKDAEFAAQLLRHKRVYDMHGGPTLQLEEILVEAQQAREREVQVAGPEPAGTR